MNVALTNLSDEFFYESRLRLNASAKAFGINTLFSYSAEDIRNTDFYSANQTILSQPRGMGFWLWKPYIILESLAKLKDGDIVIYADSGIEVIDSLDPLIKLCDQEQPIVLFANGNLVNAEWTKRDCFILMNCDTRLCRRANQMDGSFALFKKTPHTQRFLKNWLEFGKDPRILTDIPNTMGKRNSWRFIEHRHDQSILSLMAFREHLPYYRMPSQFGNHYKTKPFRVSGEFNCISQKNVKQLKTYDARPYINSPYFQLLDHHRSRKMVESTHSNSFLKKLEMRIRKWL